MAIIFTRSQTNRMTKINATLKRIIKHTVSVRVFVSYFGYQIL